MKCCFGKKLLATCVTVLMLVGMLATAAVGVSAAPVSYTDIAVGETQTVVLTLGQTTKYLRFVPEEDGDYRFYSTGTMDALGVLMDADEDVLYTDDDSGEEQNFDMTCYLFAGNVYYLSLSIYNNGTGIFYVTAEEVLGEEIEVDAELTLDEYIVATDVPEGEEGVFSFAPQWDGWYRFYTTGDADTGCELRNSDGEWIIFDEGTVGDDNCSVTYYLYAGEIYYLYVWGYGSTMVDYELYVEEPDPYNLLPALDDLEDGDTWNCTVVTDADHLYFRFVPEESGRYSFYTDGEADPYCYFYDVDYNEVYYIDDTENMRTNLAFDYYYDAGSPYYFMLGDWTASTSFTITLVSGYEEPDEPEIIEIAAGETVTVPGEEITEFWFCPETTGWYEFVSSGSCDTSFRVDSWIVLNNENDGEDLNFRAVAYCSAEEGYHFYTYLLDTVGSSYDVSVNALDESELFPHASAIEVGDTSAVSLNYENDSIVYRFVPEVSGTYTLYTTGTEDPYCYLYDTEYDEITRWDDYYYTDDFNCVITADFSAGETYYFFMSAYVNESASFDVHLQSGEYGELKADIIELDETKTVYPEAPEKSEYYAFVPTESGWYRFHVGIDGYYLNFILWNDYGYGHAELDNANSMGDVDLVCYCEAGEVYYLDMVTYDEDAVSYIVTVTEADEDNLFPGTEDIAIGQTKTVYERQYYRFVPEVSGVYTFYSTGDSDANCTLYDITANTTEYYDDIDYDEGDYNFSFSYTFVAGQSYYFCTSFYNEYEDNEPYLVTLRFEEEITVIDHIDIYEMRAPEAGETVDSYIESFGALVTGPALGIPDVAVFDDGEMLDYGETLEAGKTYVVGLAFDGADSGVLFANGYTVTVNMGTVDDVDIVDGYAVIYVEVTIPGDQPDLLLGDVDGNGRVNNRDLGVLQQYLNDWNVTIDEAVCDMDGNGRVNNRDLGALQQLLNQS